MNKRLWVILGISMLVVLTLLNIYHPFLTTHPAKQSLIVASNIDKMALLKEVREEFANIEEESLIKHQKKNVNKSLTGFNTDTQETIKKSSRDNKKDTRKVVNEGFDGSMPMLGVSHELRLFYKPSCSYSTVFMPIWVTITESLPSNVSYKEINCELIDENNVSVCANFLEYGGGITSVPALQLVSNNDGNKTIKNYSGIRSYNHIKNWLSDVGGITLKYNPNAEHFMDTNPQGFSYGSKEGFTNDTLFNPDKAYGDHGTLDDYHDKAFLDLAQEDEHGHIRDLDDDNIYKASFSTEKNTDTAKPSGYQVFTRRGQYGYVTPDTKTGLATSFDAAFSVVDSYLSMIPPLYDPLTGKATGETRTDDEKLKMKKKMAIKYADDIRRFGLCDEDKLREKYNYYERVKTGNAKLPPGISLNDYLDTQSSAAAIYDACSI